ncbi:MAG: hypothetical protein H7840_05670 [Alphaproteobacteria bacterium]
MTYDALIRHTHHVPFGYGLEQRLEHVLVEAGSEEEAFLKIKHTSDDFIACIDALRHEGILPYSVETGDPEFFTAVKRPDRAAGGAEPRVG